MPLNVENLILTGTVSINGMGNTLANTVTGNTGANTLNGGGGYDTYQIGTNVGQATINNSISGGIGAGGEVDFLTGFSDENLWFIHSGNDLQIDLLGTSQKITLAGWFGSNASAQVQSFKTTTDGLVLDSQVAQLVAAMATYSANNPGFNPTTATQMPTDPTLQNAIGASWHH